MKGEMQLVEEAVNRQFDAVTIGVARTGRDEGYVGWVSKDGRKFTVHHWHIERNQAERYDATAPRVVFEWGTYDLDGIDGVLRALGARILVVRGEDPDNTVGEPHPFAPRGA